MALEEYARKRRFENTPEPAPSAGKAEFPPGYFCVQRHDATRLHYDFRLEIDGVLKSWAVPKGPTLDPGLKHFAAHVEDHPVEYGDFEGTIPAGNYGAGSVMLWDRGTFELLGGVAGEAQIARGDLKFRLHGEKLKGDFALVHMKGRGKGNEWLILKKRDEFAEPGWDVEAHAYSVLSGRTQEEIARNLPARKTQSARRRARRTGCGRAAVRRSAGQRPRLPAPRQNGRRPGGRRSTLPASRARARPICRRQIEPMKATIADRPPKGEEWLFEVKWDGVRAIAFVENEEVRLQSRTGQRCERQYPELAVIPHQVAAETAVLDGEIAVLDDKGVSQFHLIQPRIANTDPNSIAHLARSTPVVYFAFDLLYLDGYDLRGGAPGEAAGTAGSGADAGGERAHLRRVSECGRAVAGSGAGERSGGNPRQARAQPVRIAPQPRLAEDQDHRGAGVRDRRLHGAAGRARVFRRAGAGGSRRGQPALGGQRGHGVRPETAGRAPRAAGETGDAGVPVRRAAEAGSRHDLGEAATGVPGEVRQLDAGRASAGAGVPGTAARRGRAGGGARNEQSICWPRARRKRRSPSTGGA